MYAIVEVGGMQWKISNKKTIRVPKLEEEPGQSIELDRVLLVVDNGKVNIGKPIVPQAKVKATVLSHGKAKKIKVFKKKRRKGYRVLRGHRQEYTELRIDRISFSKEDRKEAAPVQAEVKKTIKVDADGKDTPIRGGVKKAATPPKAKKRAESARPKTKKVAASVKSKAKKPASSKKKEG